MTGPRSTEQLDGEREAPTVRKRKAEHLEFALTGAAEAPVNASWADVDLVHAALPELDLEEIDLTTPFLDAQLKIPLVVAGMTGGYPDAATLNDRLGAAAQRHGLAVGVGSQRAALLDPSLEPTYAAIRRRAPDAYVIANIGVTQLVAQPGREQLDLTDVRRVTAMVAADALAVHLNFAEELVQPEGDRRGRGCAAAIARLCDALPIPVVAKETGSGITLELAQRLRELGVAAIDVGGAGGTSFVAIERLRAERQGDLRGSAIGETFAGWGIPTPATVLATAGVGIPTIATGGVRSGLDACKALTLGATVVGVGQPILAASTKGDDALDAWIQQFASELSTAMFLTGCRTPRELSTRRVVIHGRLRDWADALRPESRWDVSA